MNEVTIDTEFITLGQFLKLTDLIQSGGQAKFFLQEYEVKVNNIKENRRGKKLVNNDIISVEGFGDFVIKQNIK